MHYFTAGYVDVWSNETGTSPVHSFRGPGSVNQVELSQSGDKLLAVNDNIIRVEHTTDGQWTQQRMFELPTKVNANVPNVLFSIAYLVVVIIFPHHPNQTDRAKT